jgi:hypothetical protein
MRQERQHSGAITMRDVSKEREADLGVVLALVNRFNTYRLTYARQLRIKVDRGELLSAYDMRFLQRVFEESAQARRLAAKHAKYESLVSQATSLYSQIIRKGLENAAAKRQPTRQ